ncbi:MAG: tol-pal system-associated acyl-CoA thioesterase [Asticcacaulis sp.]
MSQTKSTPVVLPAHHPGAGWFEGRAHVLPVRIYYEDTDFTGVVYHANYLRYFERGRSDFLRLIGLDHTLLAGWDEPTAFVILRMTLDFKRAARVDDALWVRTFYEQVRGARLMIRQQIERGAEILVTAEVEAACIDLDAKPKRPPAALVRILRPYFHHE